MTSKPWLWLLLGFFAVRIAVHVYGLHADGGKQVAGEGTLVAFFGEPGGTVVEIRGQDSALVVRLEVARGNRVRIEQAVHPANAPAHGVQVREFVGDVAIEIQAVDGGGEPGTPGDRQSEAPPRARLTMRVMDSVVRVLP